MSRISTKRAQWLSMLAKLTSPMESSAAAQAFAAYAPMLDQFPDDAFTADSLEHVASQCRHGVPTYADLREHLAAWWRENRPRPTAIPATLPAQRDGPTVAEVQAVHTAAQRAIAAIHGKYDAIYANSAQAAAERPSARHLTRTELNAAYAKAGITGPAVPDNPA